MVLYSVIYKLTPTLPVPETEMIMWWQRCGDNRWYDVINDNRWSDPRKSWRWWCHVLFFFDKVRYDDIIWWWLVNVNIHILYMVECWCEYTYTVKVSYELYSMCDLKALTPTLAIAAWRGGLRAFPVPLINPQSSASLQSSFHHRGQL